MLDLLPILRKLPDFMLPIVKEGKQIHEKERDLFRNYYLNTKRDLQIGTAKVSNLVIEIRTLLIRAEM